MIDNYRGYPLSIEHKDSGRENRMPSGSSGMNIHRSSGGVKHPSLNVLKIIKKKAESLGQIGCPIFVHKQS